MNRKDFEIFLCQKRDCVKSTAKVTYYNLKRILGADKIPKSAKWLTKDREDFVSNLAPIPRKNLASSVVSYLLALGVPQKKIDPWREIMKSGKKDTEKQYESQKRTARQKAQWVTMADVRKIYKEFRDKADSRDIWAKESWSWPDYFLAQKVLQLAFHGGTQPPPRLEFAGLTYTKDPENTQGNVIYQRRKKWYALIRHSKTSKKVGPQTIPFNQATARILNKYMKHIANGEALFRGSSGNRLKPAAYGRRLQSMYKSRFGKPTGAQMLRVIFLSERYANIPSLKENQEVAKQMLHSTETALSRYTKRE